METYPIPGFADPVSSLMHLLAAGVFAVLGVTLVRRGRGALERTALGVFLFTVLFLLAMSGVYHLLSPVGAGHRVLQRLDHAAIFVLIAGSFTPVHCLLFRGFWRWGVLLLIWALAATGITLKVIFFDRISEGAGLALYLGLGWVGLASGIAIGRRYGLAFVRPLVCSGLAYTLGGLLEFLRWPVLVPGVIGPHELLHVGVLAGIGFHWRFLYNCVGPSSSGSGRTVTGPSSLRKPHQPGAISMKAMILNRITLLETCPAPLQLVDLPKPAPGPGELLVRVLTCGVCHTELDEIEGRTPPPHLPVVPGHQAVGRVEALGAGVSGWSAGQRVGVAWIHAACGTCPRCRAGEENLCSQFRATGRDANGGYAEYMTVPAAFAHVIPDRFSDAEAAPLLCAGAIGYRSLRLAGTEDGQNLGLTGFGASAHLVLKMVRHRQPNTRVFVFARNPEERAFALELGAAWAGASDAQAPEPMAAIIDTTPVWTTLVDALKNLEPGGRLVVNAIRKEEADKAALLRLDYPTHLWLEKEIKSVANVTRADVREFLQLAAEIPLLPEVEEYALEDANRALLDLKTRRVRGAKVLRIG